MSFRRSDNVNTTELYEQKFYAFLKSRILKLGPIQLQHLTGHLSQLHPEVRSAIGTSLEDIRNFLKKYNDTFVIKNNVVKIADDYESDTNSVDAESSLPAKLLNAKGVIVKLFPTFGFIKATDPIKSSVFFLAQHFGFDKSVDLTDCNLHVGTVVLFNARKEQDNKFTSKYKANKVWKYDSEDETKIIHFSKKTSDTGVFDPINLEGAGTIQKLFTNFGFINVDGDCKNSVFFMKTHVVNFDNIVDLTKVFEPGDAVEFTAHRTVKKDAKARYQALKVWKKSAMKCSSKLNSVSAKSNSNTISSVPSRPSVKPGAFLQLPGFYSKSSPIKEIKPNKSSKEMICDVPGKICPRGNNAVIKFGENLSQLADGDSSVYYLCGTQVSEISWEFNDGDSVYFDAVKIKSAPGWKALLVWTGKKPDVLLGPHLGDFSEFTDEDTDEIPDETDSLESERRLSLSSHSSLKSVSITSESSDFKTNKSCNEIYNHSDSTRYTEARNANNRGFKQRNLCKSPAVYSTRSSRSSSKESSDLDSKSKSNNDNDLNESKDYLSKEYIKHHEQFENLEEYEIASDHYTVMNLKYLNEVKSNSSLSSCATEDSGIHKNSKNSDLKFNSSSPVSSYTSKNSKTFQTEYKRSTSRNSSTTEDSGINKNSKNSKISLNSNSPVGSHTSKNSKTVKIFQNELKKSTSQNSCVSTEYETSEISKEFETDHGAVQNPVVIDRSDSTNLNCNANSTYSSNNSYSNDLKNTKIYVDTKQKANMAASIVNHNDVKGKITKAYATFAEASSSELSNPIAFSCSIFYSNKKSIEELELNDLREVLKVGDIIHFNFFVIVDDSGQSWQKVSLAWIGRKPLKVPEMTPVEFIKQNNLPVSVNIELQNTESKPVRKFLVPCNENLISNTNEVCSNGETTHDNFVKQDNLLSAENALQFIERKKKKLPVSDDANSDDEYKHKGEISCSNKPSHDAESNYSDEFFYDGDGDIVFNNKVSPDDSKRTYNDDISISKVTGEVNEKDIFSNYTVSPSDECNLSKIDKLKLLQDDYYSDEESEIYHSPEPFLLSEILSEKDNKFQTLSNMISQKLLKNRLLFVDSKVDLNPLSSEIVSMVLEHYLDGRSCQTLLPIDSSESISVACSCSKSNSQIAEVQTISTGEIMSQNIFTEY